MLIYLDHAATTPVCPQAAQAALEAMTVEFGNPSSGYALGQAAAARLAEHRAAVARLRAAGKRVTAMRHPQAEQTPGRSCRIAEVLAASEGEDDSCCTLL